MKWASTPPRLLRRARAPGNTGGMECSLVVRRSHAMTTCRDTPTSHEYLRPMMSHGRLKLKTFFTQGRADVAGTFRIFKMPVAEDAARASSGKVSRRSGRGDDRSWNFRGVPGASGLFFTRRPTALLLVRKLSFPVGVVVECTKVCSRCRAAGRRGCRHFAAAPMHGRLVKRRRAIMTTGPTTCGNQRQRMGR